MSYIQFKKETELCKPVSDYFKKIYPDCEIFYEVKSSSSGKIDVVVRYEERIYAIELKLHANLLVTNQAFNNLRFSHQSFVVIPKKSLRSFNKGLYESICKSLNINLLVINNFGNVEPLVIGMENVPKKSLVLLENQKTYVGGGEASGKCWSEFKETIDKVTKYLITNKNEPEYLDVILTNVGHHYCNAKSGSRTIKKYIDRKILKEFIFQDDGKIKLS